MFGIAATRSGRFDRRTSRRLSTWTRDYLREVALADLGCAVLSVFVAAQIRFGNNVTSTYLALPVLWIAALWLAGARLHSAVAVGHESAVADLVDELRRDRYHGLTVVGACAARPGRVRPMRGRGRVAVHRELVGGLLMAAFDARCADDTSRHR